MAVKTITITENAYNFLKQFKKDNQSFSEVIIEITKKKGNASSILGSLKHRSKELDRMGSEISKKRKDFSLDFNSREKKFRERLNDSS
jgi:predicted CopG family antitoxin